MAPSVAKTIPLATHRISLPVTRNATGEFEAGGLSRPGAAQAESTGERTCR